MYVNKRQNQNKVNAASFDIYDYCIKNNITLLEEFLIEDYAGYKLSCNICQKEWNSDVYKLLKNVYACPRCLKRLSNKQYEVNFSSFLNEDAISFYLLGVWYSDGSVEKYSENSKRASLSSIDKEWLEKIRDIISPGRPISKEINKNPYKLYINGDEFYNWLFNWGCIPNKSLILKFPENIPEKYLPDFMRGLTDGDGSVILYEQKCFNKINGNHLKTRIKYYICNANEDFLNKAKEILEKLDFGFSVVKLPLKNNREILGVKVKKQDAFIYRLISAEFKAAKFLKWMYYEGHELSLNRKYKKAMTAIETVKRYIEENPKFYKGKIL